MVIILCWGLLVRLLSELEVTDPCLTTHIFHRLGLYISLSSILSAWEFPAYRGSTSWGEKAQTEPNGLGSDSPSAVRYLCNLDKFLNVASPTIKWI